MRPAIEAKGVTRIFPTAGQDVVRALDNVSVSIGENEFFTLLGPSGCGKTTLLRLIAGFDFPSAGEILLHGQDIAPLPPFKRPVNTVFQSYALFPHMTVAENIGFGLKMLGRPKVEIEARVDAMLKLVRMEAMRNRRTSQISGGQQQRVALARALAPQPKVLLLDEPLSALDYKLRKEMQIELKRLQHETGITFIFVTHDQEEALTMSDRIAVMSAGKILQVGTPRDIYDKPAERFVADFIGETNFITAAIAITGNCKVRATLKSGATIDATVAEGFQPKGNATIVVRPEHAKLTTGKGDLSGTVETIVYFGTDTHIRVQLNSGEAFTVRQQNTRSAGCGFQCGDKVGISIGNDAAQVLRD
ncbi:ABC transporter ATP-binding protein [Mesorhizobium sp.]|uniref:ABC transporter ATP-binding protein n=1 Tax=Mesorhizobium sp. TaxID=1871066 RepID=UPI000FE33B32|nr:ABC transporter ATP-binding protein [Mesorhizobium sp.]RWA76736.1 MAG: ABC transporter ATP-binding protein [Mesorhizobium sp.]RWC05004.1 MAG: ABC transporter ATP-binding protein [Mesorhizobium sp.]RWG78864.1 MAG: ABC transporter ATP-binding protein [Mesorhizobium sp.]RWG82635.1 MAG: ABC transporter ATP-binding protein [Mesorhizobium sp.]RWK06288.1 MAG: ABC transporter ATP-binding protein [Mesorhizobium sp.]